MPLLGLVLYFARRYSEAIDELRKTLEMDPTDYPAHWWLGLVYAQTGDVTSSIRELRQALDLSDNDPGIIAALGTRTPPPATPRRRFLSSPS